MDAAIARDFGARLGLIEPEQLQAALDRFGLGKLTGASPIPFGLFGQNLFLESDQGDFVLRGMPHYDWQFPTERYFIGLVHAQTEVPVPWPYALETAPTLFGWPYVVMPRLPGAQLADPQVISRLTADERAGVARALGETLADLHGVEGPYAGTYDPAVQLVRPFEGGYGAWVEGRIRDLLARSLALNSHTTGADAAWVEEILGLARDALAVPGRPTLVLEDYKEGNTTVTPAPQGFQVSGVFDFMTAHFGDGEADLSRQASAYLREAPPLAEVFVGTYLNRRPPRPGFALRFAVYQLLDALIIWEYLQRVHGGMPGTPDSGLRAWAGPFVAWAARWA